MPDPPPTGYREIPPPAALAPWVECLWWHSGESGPSTILPDGRIDVVWSEQTGARIAGPQTRPLASPVSGRFLVVGARFHPGAGAGALGVPAHELADAHVPLDALDASLAAQLDAALGPAASPARALGALGTLLAGRRGTLASPDLLVRSIVCALGAGPARVAELARQAAISERQLQRRFHAHVGYAPRTLHRILRFQRALRALDREPATGGLAQLAAEAGYADQAHLTRETRALAGLTPAQLRARLAG
jgi:AraC-like DNA-binding protein